LMAVVWSIDVGVDLVVVVVVVLASFHHFH
jgi:hypothetical protein